MNESKFIKLSSGWLNPDAICWAEPQGDRLVLGIVQREQPIVMQEKDAAIVRTCLDDLSFWLAETPE